MKSPRKPSPLKRLRNNLMVWLRYRTLTPPAVRLPGCRHYIYIDINDRRARSVLVSDSARGKVSKPARLWRLFNQHIAPDIAIDVGVNYGECLFGATYPTSTLLFGFEANPKVFECLKKSVLSHPNSNQFALHNTLISDAPGPNQTLYVNPDWSGTASAVASIHSSHQAITHSLPVQSLDSLLPYKNWQNKRLLFKIDIEGYEAKAIAGFSQSLSLAGNAVGILEFDSDFLTKAGTPPDEFIQLLLRSFHVFRFVSPSSFELKSIDSLADLPRRVREPDRVHTDLILIKHSSNWEEMLPPALSIIK